MAHNVSDKPPIDDSNNVPSVQLELDAADLFDAIISIARDPDCDDYPSEGGDLRLIVKPNGMQSGAPIVMLTFSVGISQGEPDTDKYKPVTMVAAVTSLRALKTAVDCACAAHAID